jgi:hypothetical protein
MRTLHIQALAVAALLLAAAACDDATAPSPGLAPRVEGIAPGERLLGTVTCHVDMVAQISKCGDLAPAGGASQTRVNLTTSHFTLLTAFSFTSGGIANFYNSVQNDIGQDIGTHNGIQSDSIRAFVSAINVTGGSGSVTAYNHAGTGTFTAANQPYWEYREIVQPTAQTAGQYWQFSVPGTVTAWNYTVGVSAPIQHPNGWIDYSGPLQIPRGVGRDYTAVAYTWTGAVDNTGLITWSTTNGTGQIYPSGADRDAHVLGLLEGNALLTASKGSLTPRTKTIDVTP